MMAWQLCLSKLSEQMAEGSRYSPASPRPRSPKSETLLRARTALMAYTAATLTDQLDVDGYNFSRSSSPVSSSLVSDSPCLPCMVSCPFCRGRGIAL